MIVIAILGILATAVISLINPSLQIQKSRDARRKSDLKQIQAALELYRADCGSYPAPAAGNGVPSPLTSASTPVVSPSNCTGLNVTYMQAVPKDPKNTVYYYCTSGCSGPNNGYRIYSCLENSKDSDGINGPPGFLSCSSSVYFYAESP